MQTCRPAATCPDVATASEQACLIKRHLALTTPPPNRRFRFIRFISLLNEMKRNLANRHDRLPGFTRHDLTTQHRQDQAFSQRQQALTAVATKRSAVPTHEHSRRMRLAPPATREQTNISLATGTGTRNITCTNLILRSPTRDRRRRMRLTPPANRQEQADTCSLAAETITHPASPAWPAWQRVAARHLRRRSHGDISGDAHDDGPSDAGYSPHQSTDPSGAA